jgi:chlorobactene glucosyltransferase
MLAYLTRDLVWHLIIFQAAVLLVIISNVLVLRGTRRHRPSKRRPFVSILIPARNEAQNIARCIHSLLAQDYPLYEILVLDDHSSDDTRAILDKISEAEPRLRVRSGAALPPGWLGKSWACEQLAAEAQGELLLFTDADTFHQPAALPALVTALEGEQADLLTGFPRQEMRTWGERLMVPFFSWAFFSFTPLALAHRTRLPFLSGAVGQMLLFRRAAYDAVGGHASVRDQIAEDLALVRRVKSAGLRWRTTRLSDLISSRMYTGGQQSFDGFSKNYFAAFDFRILPYLFVFTWLAVMFWLPPAVLALHLFGMAPLAQPAVLAACIGLSLFLWAIPYGQLGFGLRLAVLYPLTVLLMEMVALNSIRLSLTGQIQWKGRKLGPQPWKWL